MKRGIIWFRNNLRLADNECIIRALDECDEVLCVYIMETETWNASAELSRISSIRAKFILESLDDLKSSIESVGGGIEFIQGQAVEEIPRLMESFGADICYAQKEDAWEETEVERLLSSQVNLVLTAGKGIWEDEDLPFVPR
jgi:deoxyribodipyrimidine photo-lyase